MLIAGRYSVSALSAGESLDRLAEIINLSVYESADGGLPQFHISFRVIEPSVVRLFQEGIPLIIQIGESGSKSFYRYATSIRKSKYTANIGGVSTCEVVAVLYAIPYLYNQHTRIFSADNVAVGSSTTHQEFCVEILNKIAKADGLDTQIILSKDSPKFSGHYLVQASKPDVYFVKDVVDSMATGEDVYFYGITSDSVLRVVSYKEVFKSNKISTIKIGAGQDCLVPLGITKIEQDTTKSNPNGCYGLERQFVGPNGVSSKTNYAIPNMPVSLEANDYRPNDGRLMEVRDGRITPIQVDSGVDNGNEYGGVDYFTDKSTSDASRLEFSQLSVDVNVRDVDIQLLYPVELVLPSMQNTQSVDVLLSGGRYVVTGRVRTYDAQGIFDKLTLTRASFNLKV